MRMTLLGVAAIALIAVPAAAAENPRVAAEVMALARAQWASEVAGAVMCE